MSRLGFGFGFNKPDYFLTLPFRYGAVAHYDFTDSSKLIPGATSADVEGWKDSTLNNYNLSQLTASAQPTFTQPNGPIVFDGSDYLEDSTGNLTFANEATFAFTLKSGVQTDNSRILSCKSHYSVSSGFHIAFPTPNDTDILHIRGSGNTVYDQGLTINTTTESTIVVTFSDTTCEVWQNGVSQGTGVVDSLTAGDSNFTVGANARSVLDEPYTGYIKNLTCYRKKLSDSEIANITAELNS
jgi:hypothetical protein